MGEAVRVKPERSAVVVPSFLLYSCERCSVLSGDRNVSRPIIVTLAVRFIVAMLVCCVLRCRAGCAPSLRTYSGRAQASRARCNTGGHKLLSLSLSPQARTSSSPLQYSSRSSSRMGAAAQSSAQEQPASQSRSEKKFAAWCFCFAFGSFTHLVFSPCGNPFGGGEEGVKRRRLRWKGGRGGGEEKR